MANKANMHRGFVGIETSLKTIFREFDSLKSISKNMMIEGRLIIAFLG